MSCQQLVSGTVKVADDLVCPDTDGLKVASDNTVIDLNGHRISCVAPASGYKGSCQGAAETGVVRDPDPEIGIDTNQRHNVHIFTSVPGATIEGFDDGVFVRDGSNVKVEHLVVTGPEGTTPANPRPPSHAIMVSGTKCDNGHNVHIGTGEKSGNDVSNHNQGIALHDADCVTVVHNRSHANNSTLAFRPGIVFDPPSNGILLTDSSRNVLRGNEVFLNGDGDPEFGGDAGIGLRVEEPGDATAENHITNNLVNENMGDGISVRSGSADNKIDNNTMLRNGRPLSGTVFYDAAGRGAQGGRPGSSPLNEWNKNNR